MMWTSYPIFSGATIKLTLDILQFCLHAGLSEKSSYGVLTALESVQAVTCNDYTLHRVTTISACWHWWAGLGAALYTALPRADQRHCGVTPPNLATARARPTMPVENILHNFGVLSVAFVTHCIKITVSSATICHSATSLPRPNFDMCEIDAAVLGCHRVRTLSCVMVSRGRS